MDDEIGEYSEAVVEAQVQQAEWKALFNFTTKAHVVPLIIGISLSVASGIVIPALALFLGQIFDKFSAFGAGTISGSDLVVQVSKYNLYLLGLGLASWLLNGSYFMFWLSFGELQAMTVRNQLFDGMLRKEMAWYDMRKSGVNAMIPRLQSQIRELQIATSQPLGFAIQYTVTLFAALGLAFYTAWNLALVTIAAIPVTAVLLAFTSARMQPVIDIQVQELTQASKLVNNAISAIDTVKCFNGQDYELWKYVQAIRRASICYLKVARANALQIGLVRVTLLGMFVQGFWYGSHLVDIGNRTAGQILTAFWACLMATQTMEQLLPQMIVLEKGRTAAATLRAVLDEVERGRIITRMIGRKTPRYCNGDIQIRNVSFAYPSRPEQRALSNASFFFPAGETTFVIGRSGSGKSTLGNLLMQFYLPASGEILLDGESIRVLDTNWLRNNVTLVQQQSVLFNETIFENIALGRQDHEKVSREEVRRCVDAAALRDTIRALPKGLDTLVGMGGSTMSGGQKQRISIARALLRDTPILVLDEATSALDHISGNLVMKSIRKWRKGKTTIIITHDISQIQEEDYAYIVDKGKIVQEGYRKTMGMEKDSPFDSFLRPGITFLMPTLMKPSQIAERRSTLRQSLYQRPGYMNTIESLRTSINSNDCMNIQLPARKPTIFRRTYTPSVESARAHRQSRNFMTSLPPKSMHMNRLSNTGLSILPLKIFPCAAEPMPFNSISTPMELEDFDPTWDTALLSTPIKTVSPKPSLHFSSMSLNTVTKPPRLKKSQILGRNRHTDLEEARDISSLKTILSTVWPNLLWNQRITLVCGFLAALVHAAATPVFSWVFSKLLGAFFLPTGRSQQALIWSLSVFGVAVSDASASYLMHYLLEMTGQAWVDSLRIEAMKRILDQPKSWFDRDKNNLSGLTECLDRNAEEMRNLVGRFAGFLFVAITMMTISVIWSLAICWKLTLVGLATAPIMYGVTRGFESVSGKWEGKSNEASEAAGSIFHETFVNIRTVRALTVEGYFHKKHEIATNKALRVGIKRAAFSGLFFGISDASIIFITALTFYYGSILAASDAFSAQEILTVFSMLLFSIANVNAIVAFIPQINSSRVTATHLLRLSSLPLSSSHEATGDHRLPSLSGPLTLTSLTFTYPLRPTAPVLLSLSLTIPLATSTAVVGPSGSGKSTLVALLLRLYPTSPESGLRIGAVPLGALHLPTWRNMVACVPQSPTLFSASVAENITYPLPSASPHATHAAIAAAASLAGIHTFVASLPEGYATPVGDGGVGLSGGQVQRIGIARALVRKPKILIMDEPTSSLDAKAAEGIRCVVRRLVKGGTTVIVVTHCVEMMRACERVVVMGDGAVKEVGRWEELVRKDGGALTALLGGGEGRNER